jgi:hypothetical protein
METLNTHFLLTVYILCKRTNFPSNIVFTTQSRLCKLLIILCGFYMKNNNSYTAHFVPVSFVVFKLSFKTTFNSVFFLNGVRNNNKTVGMETINTHFLLTVYILCKRTNFPSNIVFTTQSRIFL